MRVSVSNHNVEVENFYLKIKFYPECKDFSVQMECKSTNFETDTALFGNLHLYIIKLKKMKMNLKYFLLKYQNKIIIINQNIVVSETKNCFQSSSESYQLINRVN